MLDVFGLFKVDTLYVVIGLLVITIAAIVLAIVAICKACAMTKKYEMMMEGSDGKSMEKMVRKYTDDIINLQKTSEDNTEAIKDIYEKMQLTFQKVGVNKYDAFHEMGGKLSFALCMLDKLNNGYLVNVMHSNNGCFAYVKEIVDGQSYIELGEEGQKISDKRRSCDRNGSCSCCLREYDLFWANGYVDWTGNGKWNFKR